MIDPQAIADAFTLAEIDAKIALIQTAYDSALENSEYQLDDFHSRQRVRNQDLDKLSSELSMWLKARSIKTGASSTYLISPTYTGSHN